jgi:nicotinamidase-related amidase
VNPQETAVMLIEFQNEFCSEGGKFHDAVKSEIQRQNTIANAQRLLQGAREAGCLIIHSPFVFDEAWVDGCQACGILAGAKELGACRPGEWGTQIIEPMAPAEGEVVLEGKRALSAFTNTNAADLLQRHQISNLALAGFLTNVCVEASARSAYDAGYAVTLVTDACGATSQANQQYVENEVAPVLGQGLTVDDLLAQLKTGANV